MNLLQQRFASYDGTCERLTAWSQEAGDESPNNYVYCIFGKWSESRLRERKANWALITYLSKVRPYND